MEGSFRYLRRVELVEDEMILSGLNANENEPTEYLIDSLERLVSNEILLEAGVNIDGEDITLYFINSPKGQAAEEAIRKGEWQFSGDPNAPLDIFLDRPNIYRMYEENIGPLTPMIADALADAEDTYPPDWIEDAFRIAVEKNKRNWRYISAILDRWQTKGRYERRDRRDTEEARRRYADWEN